MDLFLTIMRPCHLAARPAGRCRKEAPQRLVVSCPEVVVAHSALSCSGAPGLAAQLAGYGTVRDGRHAPPDGPTAAYLV
jgi:hypothetical protein